MSKKSIASLECKHELIRIMKHIDRGSKLRNSVKKETIHSFGAYNKILVSVPLNIFISIFHLIQSLTRSSTLPQKRAPEFVILKHLSS